jgi:beta-1,4-mannosyltransferase
MSGARCRVVIVVLGELGYSPRMFYHALALGAAGAAVHLVGLAGAALPAAVRDHPNSQVHEIGSPPGAASVAGPERRSRRAWSPAAAGARAVRLGAALLRCLLARVGRPDFLLVQTPPALPALAVALAAARWHRAALLVDWHNFGDRMLALRLGAGHPLVRLLAAWERGIGRRADAHLCVSAAMRGELAARHGIAARVLRDLPAARFGPTPEPRRAELRRRVVALAGAASAGWAGAVVGGEGATEDAVPAIVVTATSWSADEDLALLLPAAERCEQELALRRPAPAGGPELILLITGRGGARQAELERRAAALGLARVRIVTAWFEADDYPAMLGAADLGLSLHRSASGCDLPMKIADMFGAGLPVCALDYGPCLAELVRDGENGRLFRTAGELAVCLLELAGGGQAAAGGRAALSPGVAAAARRRWHEEWAEVAAPLFKPGAARRRAGR